MPNKIMEEILLENRWKDVEYGEAIRQPTGLCQEQIVPKQTSGLLWQSDCISGQRRAVDVIYLDFCKAFDTAPPSVGDALLPINWRYKGLIDGLFHA